MALTNKERQRRWRQNPANREKARLRALAYQRTKRMERQLALKQTGGQPPQPQP